MINNATRDKDYLERPEGQPGYVPQSYIRPAPGLFVERHEDDTPAYVAKIALRWRGGSDSSGGIQH